MVRSKTYLSVSIRENKRSKSPLSNVPFSFQEENGPQPDLTLAFFIVKNWRSNCLWPFIFPSLLKKNWWSYDPQSNAPSNLYQGKSAVKWSVVK
jgi:hypothetical protein